MNEITPHSLLQQQQKEKRSREIEKIVVEHN